MLHVIKFPHLNLVQTHVRPSKLQRELIRWGAVLGITSATFQFLTNLHIVPITGRTQVVVLSGRKNVYELGNKTALEELAGAKTIDDGPQLQMCIDVATRLVSVSEHLFPREYDWRVWLVDNRSHGVPDNHRGAVYRILVVVPWLNQTNRRVLRSVGGPRLWKAFTAFYADPEAGEDELDMDFDWISTHPSNRKRERALDGLVEAALEVQRRSSWCAFLQKKVLEFVGANTEAELLHHIRAAMTQAQAEEAHANSTAALRPRLGTRSSKQLAAACSLVAAETFRLGGLQVNTGQCKSKLKHMHKQYTAYRVALLDTGNATEKQLKEPMCYETMCDVWSDHYGMDADPFFSSDAP
ncbi:hypothetical protein PInf_002172 [Phytophthora infestans]|nr:hypothetical protein PInf_002172 [Phytophthora infestans]